ncbi:BCCT family transporter [Ilyobacter polytropus]|uniref:Choline/carnitine/betaine transporter n=1 Tax=Ilyobacter polytropus (strain ATCC 51220 / DSM 2926 / LMG 16218 / CuHBu1) TaxID=572544 RepID=E3H9P7_ILYPC|nr:BCCT family transporter [Ilyobacter polytropus]ADO83436.1 choline/carnitine/betaine transporter [Ilyobacter polytropus DSM 2926]
MKKLKHPKFETDKFKEKTKLLHARNINRFGFDFHPEVSIISGVFVLIFIGLTLKDPVAVNEILINIQNKITDNFNWFFILSTNLFLVFPIYLMFSKFGEITLGGPEAKPEFTNFAWYSMLISAGMGIGLMFWSVGEPLYHANSALPMTGTTSTEEALGITFYHWGFHPWGVYSLIALALAFFAYNRGLPLSLRSVFYPILKDKVFGWIGDIIDITAVISCLFGLATSLGFGAQQINAGLNYLFGVPQNTKIQVGIIIVITFIATLSVVSGIGKGVRILSELNMRIAAILLLLMLILGPTLFILRSFNNGVGFYLNNFVSISLFSENGNAWQGSWTIFYWAWWISWSPFVGMFIARVSKGRSVREFVTAILIVPTILSFVWMSTFGATAIFQDAAIGGQLLEAVKQDVSTALFAMIQGLDIPGVLKNVLSILGTFLVISFFVTSSDSGSLVVDNLTSGGKLDSPVPQRVFWAVMEGTIAVALLIAGGSNALSALQTGVIISGFPFTIILLIMMYSLHVGLRTDLNKLKIYREDKWAIKFFNEKIHGEFEKDEKIKERMNK